MQLVAYGAQDIYLTGNPQITFFKVVYRRHTNFSMESIQQTFNGTIGTSASTVTSTISRNGDLVTNLWLEATITAGTTPQNTYFVNNTGHAFVKEVEIEIGGQRIDRHYSQWLDIWNEVSDHWQNELSGLNKHEYLAAPEHTQVEGAKNRFLIPLKFWFCKNPGLALPLIALQYHEVKLKLKTRSLSSLVAGVSPNSRVTPAAAECELWADYIYLDTDERRRFAQVSHEYLIEQVQRSTGAMSTQYKLNLNHPVKELLWVVQDNNYINESPTASQDDPGHGVRSGGTQTHGNHVGFAGENGLDYFNYSVAGAAVAGTNPNLWRTAALLMQTTGAGGIEALNGGCQLHAFGTAKLKLNGHDRFKARPASYFQLCQMQQAGHRIGEKHIYCYSFALKPEEHQPSGTCNFSRIDNAEFIFAEKHHVGAVSGAAAVQIGNDDTITVYAVNYNVLRIMSGMGGLAYSN